MSINDKIQQVNSLLNTYGEKAIQAYETGQTNHDGTERILYGYKPGFINKAMVEIFGAFGFKHEVKSIEVKEIKKDTKVYTVAVACVSVKFLKEDGSVEYETGIQFGGSNIIAGNVGDAFKGAITDAFGKALSMIGVGIDAYTGELGNRQIQQATGETSKPAVKEPSDKRFAPIPPVSSFPTSTQTGSIPPIPEKPEPISKPAFPTSEKSVSNTKPAFPSPEKPRWNSKGRFNSFLDNVHTSKEADNG